jgi:hypothetical protein
MESAMPQPRLSGLLSPRTAVLGLLAAVWLLFVFVLWKCFVPLVPSAVLDPADGHYFLGFSARGKLILAQGNRSFGVMSFGVITGPIRYWDPVLQRTSLELLTSQDRIVGFSCGTRELVAVLRDKTVSVVDLRNGKELWGETVADRLHGVAISPDGRCVALMTKQGVSIVEIESRTVRLIEDAPKGYFLAAQFHGDDLVTISTHLDYHFVDVRWWRTSDWREIASYRGSLFSPESPSQTLGVKRVYDASGSQTSSIFELDSGLQRWTLPKDIQPSRILFSADETELLYVTGSQLHLNVGRWRADNGHLLSPIRDLHAEGYSQISSDGRFVAFQPEVRSRDVPNQMVRSLTQLDFPWFGQLNTSREVTIIANADSGGVYGFIDRFDGPLGFRESTAISKHGVVVHGGTDNTRPLSIRFYALPPLRNWAWLVRWGLGPLLIVLAWVCGRESLANLKLGS